MTDRHATSYPPPSSVEVTETRVLKGIAGAPGVAVGPALVIVGSMRAAYTRRNIHTAQTDEELQRVRDGVESAKASLREVAARLPTETASSQVSILDAYLAMLDDPLLQDRIARKIRMEKKAAEWAVASSAEEILAMFDSGAKQDAYIAERRHDVEFVCDQLLRALRGETGGMIPKLEQGTVIIARDLSPADTAGMVREPVLAFVTEVGSRTSHTSIMARALEIPAVVGAPGALNLIRTGDMVIVDGLRGEVTIAPDESRIAEARARSARHLEFARGLLSARNTPCVLASGEAVILKANVELPAEAILAMDHGAQGIGLYRTEFLYIDRSSPPTEDEQYEVYRAIVEAVGPHPVTLRTFDIGGDKFVSSFPLPEEMNPALGLRAVRLALSQPEVFLVQLRAMLRASAHGDVRIMVPMVTTVREMREVKVLLERAMRDLDQRGLAHAAHVPLGMMVEVPSAAILADVFAKHAEFFSIGTNDLLQYSLAIDRTSRLLAQFASPFDPSVLRLVHNVAKVGLAQHVPVALCGAMASDPLAAVILIGLGVRELSMEAAAIPEIKEALRRATLAECEEVATEALTLDSADSVEALVAGRFALRFYDLLAGGPEEARDKGTA